MSKVKNFFTMVDFEHSLFALPFAYLGAFLAIKSVPAWHQLFWITVAMVGARSAALCLNRLIDRYIDRANPRTADWVMASGKLSVSGVWGLVIVFFVVLFYAAHQLNPLCVKLAPLAVIFLWIYSYTKRFTWWCHFILGLADGLGPIGGWIAITGSMDWRPFVLGMAVACWIAGFDAMYACQDMEFDRLHGLYSIPARFGERGALLFSSAFHLGTIVFFILTGLVLNLGIIYYAGVIFTAIILIYEHILVKPENLGRVNFASFQINHYVGLIVFATTLLDLWIAI